MNQSLQARDQRFLIDVFVARLLVLFLVVLAPLPAWASEKKGIGLYELSAGDRISALKVAWYYTWRPDAIHGVASQKFVPMLWGGKHYDKEFKELKNQGQRPILLCINEANKHDQSDMTIEEVVKLWPDIQKLGKLVSSPTPAGSDGPWIQQFMEQAKAKGLRVDFMAIHVYGPPDVEAFLKRVDSCYQHYQLPIWITEMGVVDWAAKNKPGTNKYTEKEVLEFMQKLLPELEKRSYVARYAWFGAGKNAASEEHMRPSALFETNGALTPLGQFYANFK